MLLAGRIWFNELDHGFVSIRSQQPAGTPLMHCHSDCLWETLRSDRQRLLLGSAKAGQSLLESRAGHITLDQNRNRVQNRNRSMRSRAGQPALELSLEIRQAVDNCELSTSTNSSTWPEASVRD